MNESENYLDQLLNAVDGRSDLNDSDPCLLYTSKRTGTL